MLGGGSKAWEGCWEKRTVYKGDQSKFRSTEKMDVQHAERAQGTSNAKALPGMNGT